jgi:hypothetical protein
VIDSDEGEVSGRSGLSEHLANNNLLVVMIFVLAVFLLGVGRTLLGVDSWLTFMAGREIVDNGLPHHENLTTIPLGRVWTDQQWLAQVLYYGIYRIGGLGLAVVFHAFMVTAALAVTVITSRARGASSRMTLVAAFVCLVVAPWSWQLRAQSVALPLFALTLAAMSTDPFLTKRRTFLVIPVLILWANVHGSVILGAILVALAALLALVRQVRRREAGGLSRPLFFLVAPWCCVLASPYGTDLVAYYRLLLIGSPVSKYITEWKAPGFHGYFLVFFAVAAATVVIAIWQRRRLSLYDLLVLAFTLAGALQSVRAVVWFALALAMLLPLALDGIVQPSLSPPVHRRLGHVLAGTMACLVAGIALFALTRSNGWYEQDMSARGAGVAARAAAASDTKAAVWASGRYGNWLLWKEPSLRGRVAWDVRFELLTEAELRAIVRFNSHEPGWRAATRGYPILVLDRSKSAPQARALQSDPGMTVVYADDSVVVLSSNAAS